MMQVRVLIEVGESHDDGVGEAGYIRIEQGETVVAANDEAADLIALAQATLERIAADTAGRACAQLGHLERLVLDA